MAEGITLKRIIDMDEATELSSSDYALVDSATGGPKKFALGDELYHLKEDFNDLCEDTGIEIIYSKNLFDKSTATVGYSLKPSTGELIAEEGKATSDFIPVIGGDTYVFGKNGVVQATALACFYDTNKNYLTYIQYFGDIDHSGVPEQAYYVRFAFNTASVPLDNAQFNKGTIQPYDVYGYQYVAPFTTQKVTREILDDLDVDLVASSNLFNANTVSMDNALRASTGELLSETGKVTSDFIPITGGKNYYFGSNGINLATNMACFYDADKRYVSYTQFFGEPGHTSTPLTASFVRFTFAYATVPIANAQLNENSIQPFEPYGSTYIQNYKKPVHISATNGEYTSLRQAFETEGNNCHYFVHGYYDVATDFTDEEINNASYDSSHTGWCGLVVPDNAIVEGVDNAIIDCALSSDYAHAKRMQIATLNVIGNCELRNLTVKASGNRVPIHDDFVGASGKTHKLVNCKFVQTIVDSITSHAYAVGCRNGLNIDVESCEFDPGFSAHDSNGLTTPATIKIADSHCTNWLKFEGYASGLPHRINIENTEYFKFYVQQHNLLVQNYSNCEGLNELLDIDYDNYDSFDIMRIPVSSGVVVNDIVAVDGTKASTWDNTIFGVVIDSRDSNGYAKVMKFDKAIYTPILGIVSCAENDKVALIGGRLIVDSNGTSGVIKQVSDGKGFVYFY